MNRIPSDHRTPPQPQATWLDEEYTGLWTNAADTLDDRVSEEIFDAEDERAEIEIIVHGMMHS